MDVFQEKIVQKAVNELCSRYAKGLQSKIILKKGDKNKIFLDTMSYLYEKYKYDLGFMNNPSGFKSLIVKEKNRQKKEQREMEAEIICFLNSEHSETQEDHLVSWGDDISDLSVEIQEQLGLNI
ncbi:MAG: hypothetical protein EOM85_01945 [Candidatus Moranbacteria bacterium]|nr:hypothetical protein [Candidatus Moranbacteria bacterium]